MPGSPWRVRTAYSRTLCLPCRKQEPSATPILTPWRTAQRRAICTPRLTQNAVHRPTLSPAILSTVGILCIKGGYPYGRGWHTILRERNFSSSSLAAFPVPLSFGQPCRIFHFALSIWRCPPQYCGCDIIFSQASFPAVSSVALSTVSSVGFPPLCKFIDQPDVGALAFFSFPSRI